MGYLRIVGYGILCSIALVLLVIMCAVLKNGAVTHDTGHDHAEGVVIRASASKASMAQ
jgi:hypothetical protein